MARSNEEIKVGVVVTVALLLFLVALVFVGGVDLLRKKKSEYTTHFKFAGGLQPGSLVRYGGLKVGTVASATLDRDDSTRIKVVLQIDPGTPIKVNSQARISSLGFLGENYVEVSPGTRNAALLPKGSEIPAMEIVQLSDVFNNVNNITLNATKLVNDLDDQVLELAKNANVLIKNLNDVVSPENKEHFTSIMANTDGMLKDSRPHIEKTLANLDTVTGRMEPVLANLNVTLGKANNLADHLDGVIVDNRKEIHDTIVRLQSTLNDAARIINDLDDTLGANRGNLDETLENIRATSENLKQFTDTLKQHPYSLIRIKTEKDREPPRGK
jgi:phospholipid/cholesterol/gamma-HCH transport system substrate-binding protein